MVSLRGGVANTVAYDLAKIDERWGLRPDQMLDYKSLKGDPTDNIPGIPGVGEKTASKLIATWGTLDALYEHLDEVTPEKLAAAPRRAPRDGAREPRADAPRPRRGRGAGPRARPGGGVRPRGRRPDLPRVRVPHADRPAAAARRRAARGRRSPRCASCATPASRRRRGRRARRRAAPGGRAGGARRPTTGRSSCRWTSTWSSGGGGAAAPRRTRSP